MRGRPIISASALLRSAGTWHCLRDAVLLLCAAALTWWPPRIAAAANFASGDAAIVAAAEAARLRSLLFWTGTAEFPEWLRPCPVTYRETGSGAGGQTSFQFAGGEVFGWKMSLTGRREAMFDDALPHEVDHMVRATLTRRPIVRWADEGAAVIFESAAEHARQRTLALRHASQPLTQNWWDAAEYPASPSELERLYAIGFSICEYLVARHGPQAFLEFQRDPRPVAQRFEHHFDQTASQIEQNWRHWLTSRAKHGTDCGRFGCVIHHDVHRLPSCRCDARPQQTLTVWTAVWCGPCRAFWHDLQTDEVFRRKLESEVHIHAIDVAQHPILAQQRGIASFPTFEIAGRRIVGYEGPQWLLDRLESIRPAFPVEATATQQPAPPSHTPPDETPSEPPPGGRDLEPDSPGSPRDEHRPFVTTGDEQAVTPAGPLPEETAPAPGLLGGLIDAAPVTLSLLEAVGLIGGTAATGGLGTAALFALSALRRRRRVRAKTLSGASQRKPCCEPCTPGGSREGVAVPFPRKLDEARELLRLRQTEGRVAALDALRGMFLEDELERLTAEAGNFPQLEQLKQRIDHRVAQVAPISTQVDV